jgi:hypothetical protein
MIETKILNVSFTCCSSLLNIVLLRDMPHPVAFMRTLYIHCLNFCLLAWLCCTVEKGRRFKRTIAAQYAQTDPTAHLSHCLGNHPGGCAPSARQWRRSLVLKHKHRGQGLLCGAAGVLVPVIQQRACLAPRIFAGQ